jgi:hypothetical protein
MWMEGIECNAAMFDDKRPYSRAETSTKTTDWSKFSVSKREDHVFSRAASRSRSSNRHAVAATPDIAIRVPLHTRGLTPENKVPVVL